MSKTVKSIILAVLVVGFLVFAGVLMNHSTKTLEHWAYPIEYEDTVKSKAKENGLPESIVFAVIRTESNFNSDAESRVGARGLMQITKDTYEWIDYYRGATGAEWGDFYTPEVNIDYGTWLLAYLYNEFGCWETAIAAYNAGPNIVKKWLADAEYSDDGVTLHDIPYSETDNYVKKVMSYQKGYKNAYNFD